MNAARRTLIIAEAGVNHNGSVEMALELVDAAASAGADVVKFQTFQADRGVSSYAPKADYQKATTGTTESQLEMVRRLELDLKTHRRLLERCRERGIAFLSTPCDAPSVDLLVGELGLKIIKIPSGEITNGPLLLHIARTQSKMILSTGMSTLGEIEEALGVLAFGLLAKGRSPSRQAFQEAYISDKGQEALQEKVTLLHCTTEYPAPFEEVNLKVIETLRRAFCLPVGYSDHTEGIAVPIAAVALGATVIEKHFTLDRSLPGPDHRASLEPEELGAMVRSVRQIERAVGGSKKIPTPSEFRNRAIARKSLVAAKQIEEGECFSPENVTAKRPGDGMSPMESWNIFGTLSKRVVPEDTKL